MPDFNFKSYKILGAQQKSINFSREKQNTYLTTQ